MKANRKSPRPSQQPSPQEVRIQIALAAYYLAERRGFEPGRDLDDWLAAEAELSETAKSAGNGDV